ncbi:hypothetical protein D9619_011932 [Psilocybe cf. subviscida]|uniref:ubiquitinyl hydrolase 1 n=1 Tax=Psilocybe cf. subviscida TaxID=2480587 RepID=A0A8H5B0T8_9AGAR|nr:hypothetical protein D9619_011932 [Psilocybe cf. subviscida]
MADTPQLLRTPTGLRKPVDLPPESDGQHDKPAFANKDLAGLSSAEVYNMNQDLLNESVPTRPLIDSLAPMSTLRSEYENGSAAFLKQIDWLIQHSFDHIQRTKGDGDCFYRSLGFAYVEGILNAADKNLAVGRSLSLLESTKSTLDAAGIEQFVYEDFYDALVSLVENIMKPGKDGVLTAAKLLQAFQEAEVSNAIVMALRLLTSAQIRQNRDDYEGFLVHPDTKDLMDVDSFCNNVVQALGKEADNVEIQALTSALQLNLDLAYLNGVRADGVDFVPFRNDPDKDCAPLVLLYRPGHYDILVRQSK